MSKAILLWTFATFLTLMVARMISRQTDCTPTEEAIKLSQTRCLPASTVGTISLDPISDLYSLAWELQDKESERYWQRNSAFLIIHGGLLAVIGAVPDPSFSTAVLAISGLFFAGLWWAVLRRGRDYVYRWNVVLDKIESTHEGSIIPLHRWNTEAKIMDKPSPLIGVASGETTDLMRRGAVVLLIVWAVLFFRVALLVLPL
jgi:hypothetical protein